MRVKINMNYMARLFGIEDLQVRVIFSGLLSSDAVNALENRFATLADLSEASDSDLLMIPGITEEVVKSMRTVINNFFKTYVDKDLATKMPKDMSAKKRVIYGEIMKEAEIVSSIKRLKKAIEKLPKRERKYVHLVLKKKTTREISEKLKIPSQDLGLYRIRVYAHLREYATK